MSESGGKRGLDIGSLEALELEPKRPFSNTAKDGKVIMLSRRLRGILGPSSKPRISCVLQPGQRIPRKSSKQEKRSREKRKKEVRTRPLLQLAFSAYSVD